MTNDPDTAYCEDGPAPRYACSAFPNCGCAVDYLHHPTVVEWCRECGGDGGWSTPIGVDYGNGSVIESWTKCAACDGRGETEVECKPATLEDITNAE